MKSAVVTKEEFQSYNSDKAAKVNCNQVNDLDLLYLKIGHYPEIHHPLDHTSIISAPSTSVHVGKCHKIILHV